MPPGPRGSPTSLTRSAVPSRLAMLTTSAAAAVAVLLIQNLVRVTWQVRTLPERVMEWLLVFVPLDLFERGLQRLGGNAKEVALIVTQGGMAALLVLVGAAALHAGWSGWRLLGLGLGLWLVAMGVVMPVTGGGLFGTGLPLSPALTNAVYGLVFLGYASVLQIGAMWARRARPLPPRGLPASGQPAALPFGPDRRALLASVLGAMFAYGVARFAGREGGLVASSLPLASLPSVPATTEPGAAETPTTEPIPEKATGPVTPVATPTPAPTAAPALPTERPLARDKDGSLTAAGRPQGTLAPPITETSNFYVVTKNAVADPALDAGSWRLVIDGLVARPVQVDYQTLRSLPIVDVTKTLECISNFTDGCEMATYGCDLISTARWKGARLGDIVDLAGGLQAGAVGLAFLAIDEFSAGLPAAVADDPNALVVYEMNGRPLPREHGYPARLLVPGRYGMKNPKWLVGIRALDQEYVDWYQQRAWSKEGIVKTMARIDVPAGGASLPPGRQPIAGIAYAGDRGVSKVEFSADGGQTWQTARFLEPAPAPDAMVRWEGAFDLPPGAVATLVVRATDGTGVVQTDEFALPQPEGASGRHSIAVYAA